MSYKLFSYLVFGILLVACSKESSGPGQTLNFDLVYPPNNEIDLVPGFEFTWTVSELASSYTLQVSRPDVMFTIPSSHVFPGLTGESHSIPDLKYGVDYNWSVTAFDNEGNAFSTFKRLFTTKKNHFVWKDLYYAPQFDADRTIKVYLPPDYETSNKNYPVIYLHDGLNAFRGEPRADGGFGVPYSLNELFQKQGFSMIAVAIRGGGRLDLYSPWENEGTYDPEYAGSGGKGDSYIDFIVETLKPDIDNNFRTLPDAENTAICGYSLGGLISLYAQAKFPGVFGKALALSPSFWYTDDKIYPYVVEKLPNYENNKLYMWAGSLEHWGNIDLVGDMDRMTSILDSGGFQDYKYFKEVGGNHSSFYWAQAFPKGIKWLFLE